MSAGKLTEKQFQARIVAYAKLRGWKCYFTWRSIHSPAGFPDLFMVRGCQALAVELKVGRNATTPAQDEWIAALNEAHITTRVVYPEDEDDLYRLLDPTPAAPTKETQG